MTDASQFGQSDLPQPSRREFVQAGVGLSAAGLAAFAAVDRILAKDAPGAASAAKPFIAPGDVILFQGDSITDSGRKMNLATANSQEAMGRGYAWLAGAQLLLTMPDAKLKIYNRGISGNKVYQLVERWQADCLDLKPNVLSVLIGVNDFSHKRKHIYDGTVEKYETDYTALLKRTKEKLPDVKLVVCEPFLLKVGAVDDTWFPEFNRYRAAAERVAKSAGAVFVPFQTMFDAAVKVAPPAVWAGDGVHPTCDGSAIMAHRWLQAVGV